MYVQIDILYILVYVNYFNYVLSVDSIINRQCDINVWQLIQNGYFLLLVKREIFYGYLIRINLLVIKGKLIKFCFLRRNKSIVYLKKKYFFFIIMNKEYMIDLIYIIDIL